MNWKDYSGWAMGLVGLFLMAMASIYVTVSADGAEYDTQTKPVRCQNPDLYEDGTPLPVSDIEKATIWIGQTPGDNASAEKFDIVGGCADGVTYALTNVPAGQYYQWGTVTTRNGKESPMSNNLPFSKLAPRPMAPTMLE